MSLAPSVSVTPGLTELTRILRAPSSLAITRVTESSAAFVAEYTTEFSAGFELATELMLMMLPPAGPKYLRPSCTARIEPSTLVSNSR